MQLQCQKGLSDKNMSKHKLYDKNTDYLLTESQFTENYIQV